jgi:uncharacterized membrane protein YeaQ/YmgE (transglycosylase-associated protein family)
MERHLARACRIDSSLAARSLANLAAPVRWPTIERASGRNFNRYSTARGTQMNLFIWHIIGGVVGWLASLSMRTDGQQGIVLNVVVGLVGAFLAGWFVTPMIGVGTINQYDFSLASVLVSLIGAVILLAIVNLFRRGRVR